MNAHENDDVAAYLARTAPEGATSKQVAATVTAALTGIDRALTPIIGKSGVAALYKRTLHLAAHKHACLAVAQEGIPASMDVVPLAAALEQLAAAEAAAAGAEFLQTFHHLLTTLVGFSLAERLLRPVWSTFSSGPSAKEPKS